MKSAICGARLSVLVLAVSGACAAFAQADGKGTLGEVVVTASRFADSANVLPYGVSVITAGEIERSGATSISAAIMKVLGVPGRLDLSGANNYSLDLRGFGQTASSNQVVVVDGRRLSVQDLSGDGLGDIPIDQVQRIEVVRGSGAVLYGEGATGGVILVTTKAGMGVERHNAAVLSATTGTHGLEEYRSSATVVHGGFSLDMFGSDRKSDGHRDNFASVTNNLGATVQWSNDWLRVGAQSSRNMNRSGFPGPLSEADFAQNPRKSNTPTDYGQIKSETSAAFLEAFTGDWQLGLDLGQRTRKVVTSYSGFLSNSSTDTSTANARLRHSYANAQYANTLTFGLDSENWNSMDYADLKGRADSMGIYINDDFGFLASGTHLSVGLRSENMHKTRNTAPTTVVSIDQVLTAWNVGATQELGSNTAAFARVGQSFRVANVDEFNFVTPGSSLRPQMSRDTELGARWHSSASRLELRLYQNELNDEIAYDGSAVGPFSPFSDGANVNLDPTIHRGVELEGHHNFTDRFAVRMSAAVRQSRFVSGVYSGSAIALVPTRTLAVGVEVVPAEGHSVDVSLAHVSSQYTDYANQCTMPEYNTVDARYAYTLKSLEFAMSVSNLTDTKYYTQSFGCTAGVIQAIYPESGRALAASVKLRF